MKSEQGTFFERSESRPLADRMRPRNLSEFVGQKHLLSPGSALRRMIEEDRVGSMIFWGPPGTGKTTLARIISEQTRAHFVSYSAVTGGIREVRDIMEKAEKGRRFGERTILFVDEIHRFNRAQQDAFLPYVEKGSIVLIGATTENPSFEVNSALLSRCRVFVLRALEREDICRMLRRTMEDPRGFGGQEIRLEEGVLEAIAGFVNGDARMALGNLEMAVLNAPVEDGVPRVTRALLGEITGKKMLLYDRQGEEHYNLISALHKSMRNSDPDAAVYWLARMLEGGEDPLYVARRMIRFASEDVGLADPRALEICVAVYQACHFLGMPECTVHLTQAAVYLSLAPKSNALYMAYDAAREDARQRLAEPVPLHIRNAVTDLMGSLGYGEGYEYAHDTREKLTAMTCLPEELEGRRYYQPTREGLEGRFATRLEEILAWKAAAREKSGK